MRFRRCAVALSTMTVLVTGGLGSLSPAPAVAGTRTPVFTFLGIVTNPIKVHGYQMTIEADQFTVNGATRYRFLSVTLLRREPTTDKSELHQIHQWGWGLPKTAFHLHRDLSSGWIDTGDRMGALGHLHMRFSATSGAAFTGACDSFAQRRGTLEGRTDTSFILRTDSTFFGTLKARHFGATATGSTQCGRGGGGGSRPCPSAGLGAMVSDQPLARTKPAPIRLTPRTVAAAAAVRPGGLMHRVLSGATTHQFAFMIRTKGFNIFEMASGGRHEAHYMALFTSAPILTGGVAASATDLQVAPPADVASWLSGTESITGPGDPTARTKTCKSRTFRSSSDDAITTVAGAGGGLTAHFDSVGDVAMQDGLSGSVQQVRRVS